VIVVVQVISIKAPARHGNLVRKSIYVASAGKRMNKESNMRRYAQSPYGSLNEAAFTRQHYEAIAKLISDIKKEQRTSEASHTLSEVAKGLCDIFQRDNPRFDKGFFLAKCGV